MAKDWDRIADEEEAKLDAADARVPTAPDASASAPRGRAEAEERSKRDALKAAKDVWRAKDDAMLAAKLVLADETGVDRVITQADLGDDKHAVHIKNAKDAAYVLDPRARRQSVRGSVRARHGAHPVRGHLPTRRDVELRRRRPAPRRPGGHRAG